MNQNTGEHSLAFPSDKATDIDQIAYECYFVLSRALNEDSLFIKELLCRVALDVEPEAIHLQETVNMLSNNLQNYRRLVLRFLQHELDVTPFLDVLDHLEGLLSTFRQLVGLLNGSQGDLSNTDPN